MKLTEKKTPASSKVHSHSPKIPSSKRVTTSSVEPRSASVEQDDDEDLKKALQMSLDDMKGGSGYVPQYQLPKAPESRPAPKPVAPVPVANTSDEEEDEELKAAIAASLRDMEEQKAKASWATSTAPTGGVAAGHPAVIERPDHELSPAEAENISLFATLVDRLQTQPPGTILREPQIQELYESIGALRPKLARTFGETMSKYETLCDLHAKLGTVVRYYDRMLEERLSYTYGRHGLGGTVPQAPQAPAGSDYSAVPTAESFYGAGPSHAQSTAPRNPSMSPSQPQYANYYTQPQAFDQAGGFPSQPSYPQYNGYSAPSMPPPVAQPQNERSQPPPQSQPQRDIPTPQLPPAQPTSSADQQLPPPSQTLQHPPTVSSPPPAAWQYPNPVPNSETHYSYPPPPKEAYQQQHASPPHAYPPQPNAQYHNPMVSARDFPSVPEHQPKPKVVEESLIDL